jgi:hypothetical protein
MVIALMTIFFCNHHRFDANQWRGMIILNPYWSQTLTPLMSSKTDINELCTDDIVLDKTNQEAQQFKQGTNLTFNPIDNVINLINFHNCLNQVHHNVWQSSIFGYLDFTTHVKGNKQPIVAPRNIFQWKGNVWL